MLAPSSLEVVLVVPPWGVGEGKEGGVPPPLLSYPLPVPNPSGDTGEDDKCYYTQSPEDTLLVNTDEADLSGVLGVIRAIALGVVVDVEHHGD